MPEPRRVCPTVEELAEFHAGRLVGEAARRVAEHAEGCDLCRAERSELELDQRFREELRGLFSNDPPPTPGDGSGPDPEREALTELLREAGEGLRYEFLGELGHGGMGVVYEVRDRVLRRDLAMKVAGAGGRSADGARSPGGRRLARFLEEVRITGRLEHPAILPVHELGVDEQGRAFFTMRKVDGQTLRDVFEEYERGERGWTLQRLIGVLQQACDALAYAHSEHVVHRDLKPANIMVGRFGAVYVMDWGVAKVVGSQESGPPGADDGARDSEARAEPSFDGDAASPRMTLDGEILGTPSYMAPEQALGALDQVDARVDVYSMGAILYRLLAGRAPYQDEAGSGTPEEAWRRLLAGPPPPLAGLAPKAPPELLAICRRAMAREPDRRYASMEGLTADLRAWLEGRVVRAHRTGAFVALRKWVGRNRALTGAVVLGLAVVCTLLLRHSMTERRSRDRVARGAAALTARRLLDVEPAEALRLAVEVAEDEPDYVSRTMVLAALQPLALHALLDTRNYESRSPWHLEGSRRAWSPDGAWFVVREHGLDGSLARIRSWDVRERRFEGAAFESPAGAVHALHPDGSLIAAGSNDGSLELHDRVTGESRTLRGPEGRAHTDCVSRLAFAPDGSLLASASWDGTVRLWNPATGELVHSLEGHEGVVTTIEFDAAGERLLSASGPTPNDPYVSDHTARVWSVADGACLRTFEGHSDLVTSARFQPAGELVLTTSYDRTALLWDPKTGEVRDPMEFEGVVWDGAFSPDGSTLAVAFDSGFLVRSVAPGWAELFGEYQAHDGRSVNDVEFAPDGGRLLTTGRDGIGRVWELRAGHRPRLARRLFGFPGMNYGSWSPDGSMIATLDAYTTRLWHSRGNRTTDEVLPTGHAATRARFHPRSDRVLLTFEDRPAREYAFAPGEGLRSPTELGDAPARDVATSADGAWTLVAESGGPLRLWRRSADGASREAGSLALDVSALHPARRGNLVGATLVGGGAVVIDCAGAPAPSARLPGSGTVYVMRFSEDGRRVALGTEDRRLLVVDLAAGGRVLLDERIQSPLAPVQSTVWDVCFYDDGRRLVSVGPVKGVKVWDVDAGRELRHVSSEIGPHGGVLVLRGGRQLVTRDQWNPSMRLAELGEGPATQRGLRTGHSAHRNRITGWSLDERRRRLLTTSLDHRATIWDLEDPAGPWVTFAGHDVPVLTGDLSRDGEWAVTADASGRVFVWPTDPVAWAKRALPVDTRPEDRRTPR